MKAKAIFFRQVPLWATMSFVLLLLAARDVEAAPNAELWPRWQKHDPASKQKVDYGPWETFLKQYVVSSDPSGINRVRYQLVNEEDRKLLQNYLQFLQGLPISSYNRAEQRAYWINLYNGLTVDLILSRYPVASIRDINISPGLLSRGPWGAKLLTIEGEKLSLDDIEHRILRPGWRDDRIHYAINCASLGCPNLQPVAYTTANMETLLEKGAREYVNHPRGVAIRNGTLHVSSIYVWFQEDFGGSTQGLMEHWTKYATPTLGDALKNYSGGLEHDYDWRLNGAESKPQP